MVGNSLVPILTSDTDKGFILTASSIYNTGRAKYMAFDNSTTTRWRSLGEVNAWLQIEFPKSIRITGISINSGSGGTVNSFKTSVSKDGSNYNILYNTTGYGTWEFTFELATSIISKFVKFQGNDNQWNHHT